MASERRDEAWRQLAAGSLRGDCRSERCDRRVTERAADQAGRLPQQLAVDARVKVETGAVIQVPMFVEIGERIKVDTRDRRYISRV